MMQTQTKTEKNRELLPGPRFMLFGVIAYGFTESQEWMVNLDSISHFVNEKGNVRMFLKSRMSDPDYEGTRLTCSMEDLDVDLDEFLLHRR